MDEPFVKKNPTMPPAYFAAEAASLRWLAEPGAVPVAAVLDVGHDHLTVARIEVGVPTAADAERFGRALAALHDAGADGWGAGPPGCSTAYLGTLEQENRRAATWGEFFGRTRLRPYARLAAERGALPADGLRIVERLVGRLADGRYADKTSPARIHGDLWSGNVLTSPGGWTLIDPAAHGGHRLTDLAMLDLFGNPFLDTSIAAYEEASSSLPDRWRDLVGLHQVHPLLVHAALFGAGYGRQAVETARGYL